MGFNKQQNTSVYNCSCKHQSNSSVQALALILQAKNTGHGWMTRGLAAQDYNIILCAQTGHDYCASLQTNILSITRVQMFMYTCEMSLRHVSYFIGWIVNF